MSRFTFCWVKNWLKVTIPSLSFLTAKIRTSGLLVFIQLEMTLYPNCSHQQKTYYWKQYISLILQMKTWNMHRDEGLVFNTTVNVFNLWVHLGPGLVLHILNNYFSISLIHNQPCLHWVAIQYLFISCFFQKNHLPYWARLLPSNPVTCSSCGRTRNWTQTQSLTTSSLTRSFSPMAGNGD